MKSDRRYDHDSWIHIFFVVVMCVSLWAVSPLNVLAGPTTFHVATNGNNDPSCGPVDRPCRQIQYAVNLANSGDVIKVAEGTYTFDSAHDVCTGRIAGSSAVVCYIDKELTLLGGYSTGNWSQADPDGNPTIIDGGDNLRGVRLQKSHQGAPTASLHMEGFIIQNGVALGKSAGSVDDLNAFGGGLLSEHASVTLKNMVFRNNEARGGTTSQTAGGAGAGGGLAVNTTWGGVSVTLDNVVFEDNLARGGAGQARGGFGIGGGAFFYGISGHVQNLVFDSNQALAGSTTSGSGVDASQRADAQGAAAAIHGGSNMTWQNVVAKNNVTQGGNAPAGEGGGAFGGALFVENSSAVMADMNVRQNQALGGTGQNNTTAASQAWGGGIASMNSNVSLHRAEIIANTAEGGAGSAYGGAVSGGGVALVSVTSERRHAEVINCVIADNDAQAGKGKLVGGGGGGLWLLGVDADIVHTTIAHNTVEQGLLGQGVILVAGAQPTAADVQYTIISDHTGLDNTAALHAQAGTTVNLNQGLYANNTIDDNHDRTFAGAPRAFNGLSGMIRASSVGYVAPGASSYDYHLRKDSPARDKVASSSVSDDIDGDSRAEASPADIGADEYLVTSSVSLSLSVLGRDALKASWSTEMSRLSLAANHYHLYVSCESGGTSPSELRCGSHVDVPLSEHDMALTDLTPYRDYTVSVSVVDANDKVIETSNVATAFATDHIVWLPFTQASR